MQNVPTTTTLGTGIAADLFSRDEHSEINTDQIFARIDVITAKLAKAVRLLQKAEQNQSAILNSRTTDNTADDIIILDAEYASIDNTLNEVVDQINRAKHSINLANGNVTQRVFNDLVTRIKDATNDFQSLDAKYQSLQKSLQAFKQDNPIRRSEVRIREPAIERVAPAIERVAPAIRRVAPAHTVRFEDEAEVDRELEKAMRESQISHAREEELRARKSRERQIREDAAYAKSLRSTTVAQFPPARRSVAPVATLRPSTERSALSLGAREVDTYDEYETPELRTRREVDPYDDYMPKALIRYSEKYDTTGAVKKMSCDVFDREIADRYAGLLYDRTKPISGNSRRLPEAGHVFDSLLDMKKAIINGMPGIKPDKMDDVVNMMGYRLK